MAKAERQPLKGLLKAQLGFMGAGILLALMMSTGPEGKTVAPYGFLVLALALPAILLFVGLPVAVHEAGHALVAWALGVRVVGFDVLGFEILHRERRELTQSVPMGYVRAETTIAQDRRSVWIPITLAGPLLGTFVATLEIALGRAWRSDFAAILNLQGGLGLIFNGISMIPSSRADGFKTDGTRFIDLLRPNPQTFASQGLWRAMRAMENGDLSASDPEDIRRAMCHSDPLWRAFAAALACTRAIAVEPTAALAAAYVYMEAADGSSDATLVADARLEAAFCEAFFRGDVATSQALLDPMAQIPRTCWGAARRADIALYLAQGDFAEARGGIVNALQICEREQAARPHPSWLFERRLIEIVESRLRSSASA